MGEGERSDNEKERQGARGRACAVCVLSSVLRS